MGATEVLDESEPADNGAIAAKGGVMTPSNVAGVKPELPPLKLF
jgi:hypothetical protein